MATGIQQGFLPIIIGHDLSELRQGIGFWSNNQVYYNPTDKIIVLDSSLTVSNVKRLLDQIMEENIEKSVQKYIDKGLSNDTITVAQICIKYSYRFSKYFSCQYFPDFQDEQFRIQGSGWKGKLRTSLNSQVSWKAIGEWLNQHYSNDPMKQKQILIKQILYAALQKQYVFNSKASIKSDWPHLLHSDLMLILDQVNSIDELLTALGIIRQFSHTPGSGLSATLVKNKEVFGCYKKYGLKAFVTSNSVMHQIYNLTNAVNLVLVLLARHRKILLPSTWSGLKTPIELIEPSWEISKLPDHSGTLLSRILCSSTIKDLSDVPASIHSFFNDIKNQSVIFILFYSMLLLYEKQYLLPKWPVQNLNRKKAALHANNRYHKWSPEWLQQEGYSRSWIHFVRIYWQSSAASDSGKALSVSYLLTWSQLQKLHSPADIQLINLRNIHNPDCKNTFYYFCKALKVKHKSIVWEQSNKIFSNVVNTLKLTPDPILNLIKNPFEHLENPFKQIINNKTARNRIDTAVHELMIDILLEPDKDGTPTYNWVRNHLKYDWFEWFDPDTKITKNVWCPSRAACLALLLTLPIRQKQARWLDRGLLDKHIWNIDTNQWEKNTHSLSKWTYSNGNSQEKQYGRYCGVLQPIFEPISKEHELGIFINTNKTQMWNPDAKTGYEIPWPSRQQFIKKVGLEQKQVQWLERPYAILKQQIKWQNMFHPNPEPISFLDVALDANSQNLQMKSQLPYFTPVFADLTNKYFKDNDEYNLFYKPISSTKLGKLFDAIAVEAEERLNRNQPNIRLTTTAAPGRGYKDKTCIFDIHSLRVSGISRFIEMGIPIDVVQEFIVGHSTIVMTNYYKKHTPNYIRMQLLDKITESNILGDWEHLCKSLSGNRNFVVTNSNFASDRPKNLLTNYTGWKLVQGGICPLGGTECHNGQPIEVIVANNKILKTYGPVVGGCGNCRFFSTGPAFLVQQAQVANELMLECRAVGQQKNQLLEQLNKLDWENISGLNPSEAQLLALDRQVLKDKILELDLVLEPKIIEWVNRYRMLEESNKLLNDWRNHMGSSFTTKTPLLLVAGADHDEFHEGLEICFKKASDFALVRNILEGAKLRGGLAKASSIAKEHLREFTDRILRVENAKHLLIDIRDKKVLEEATFLMASLLESLVGDEHIQECLDSGKPLGLAKKEHKLLLRWAEEVVTMANNNENKSLKLADLLPKHISQKAKIGIISKE